MAITLEQFGLDRLPPGERLELLGLIWDSLTATGAATPIPEWHREELHRRVAEADADPDGGVPWEVVRAELLEGS